MHCHVPHDVGPHAQRFWLAETNRTQLLRATEPPWGDDWGGELAARTDDRSAAAFCVVAEEPPTAAACADTPGWANDGGHGCANYSKVAWCADGALTPGSEWTGGEEHLFPERHCCVCGKWRAPLLRPAIDLARERLTEHRRQVVAEKMRCEPGRCTRTYFPRAPWQFTRTGQSSSDRGVAEWRSSV